MVLKVMLQRLAVLIVLIVSIWTITAIGITDSNDRRAFACSCIEIKPPQAEYEQSNAVFSGKIVDLETTDDRYPSKVATFDVHTVWKGISHDTVKITTGMGGADCGYPFEENEDYLVYAYGEEGIELGASSCSQTKPLDRAEADLVTLGQGDSTFAGEMATYTGSKLVVLPYLVIGAVGAAGAVIATALVRKKRK